MQCAKQMENWEGAECREENLPGEWIGRVGKAQPKAADPSAMIASVSRPPLRCYAPGCAKATPQATTIRPDLEVRARRPLPPATPCDRRQGDEVNTRGKPTVIASYELPSCYASQIRTYIGTTT
jgi:hypothetical protein